MGERVEVNVGGNADGAVSAIRQAANSLERLNAETRLTDEIMQRVGTATAQAGRQFLQAATDSRDYADRLAYLQADLARTRYAQQQAGESGGMLNSIMQGLGQSTLGAIGPLGMFVSSANPLVGVTTMVANGLFSAGQSVVQFGENLMSMATSEAWSLLQQGIGTIQSLSQQVFDLTNTTQKMTYSWSFLYGGKQQAGELAAWTKQESLNLPDTRQDLLAAITAMGRAGLSKKGIEDYMPLLGDLQTLNPNMNLQQVAMTVQGAMHGYSRMLRYDLGIDPSELDKYGLKQSQGAMGRIENPEMLLPALEAWAKDRGVLGSAQKTAHETFWGAESSFVDRLQNLGLTAGGMNDDATVRKGTFFGMLTQELNDISSFLDRSDVKERLTEIAGTVSDLAGAAIGDGAKAIQNLVAGLHDTGIDTAIEGGIGNLAHLLADPNMQQGVGQIAHLVGTLAGNAGMDLGKLFGGLWAGVTGSGIGQTILHDIEHVTTWLADPTVQSQLQQLGTLIGGTLGTSVQTVASDLGLAADAAGRFFAATDTNTLTQIATVFVAVGMSIETVVLSLITMGAVLGDIVSAVSDASQGHFDSAIADLQRIGADITKAGATEGAALRAGVGIVQAVSAAGGGGGGGGGGPTTGGVTHSGGHHEYASGGLIAERIIGIGLSSGDRYTFGESGREWVVPEGPHGGGGGPGGLGSAGSGVGYSATPGSHDSHDTNYFVIQGASSEYIQQLIDAAQTGQSVRQTALRLQPGAGNTRIGAVGFRIG